MKNIAIPIAMAAIMLISGSGLAQGKKAAAAPALTARPATPAASGPMNMKDIEGKWKIERVDIDMKSAEGEAIKESQPGGDEDFLELQKGTLNSYISGQSENKPYSLSGGYLITRADGMTDSMKIMSLSKTNCVLSQHQDSAEGTGTITITLKK